MLSAQSEESPDPQIQGGVERRRAPRFKRDSQAQLIFWPASMRTAPIDVRLVDYSRTGVGVLNHEAIIIGQKFVLREPFVTHGSTCIYTVVRCNKREDGYYIIGLHATPGEDSTQAVEEPQGTSRWVAFAYFCFALVGAVLIVATALLNR